MMRCRSLLFFHSFVRVALVTEIHYANYEQARHSATTSSLDANADGWLQPPSRSCRRGRGGASRRTCASRGGASRR